MPVEIVIAKLTREFLTSRPPVNLPSAVYERLELERQGILFTDTGRPSSINNTNPVMVPPWDISKDPATGTVTVKQTREILNE